MKKFLTKDLRIPEFVSTVIGRLQDAGFQAYVVGGAVRNHCLQRRIADWDVATSASPEEIRALFHDTKNFSLKHDTVTLVHAGRHYEVTTFKGSRTRGRSIEEDLGHRDFTINAMAYDPHEKTILDPHRGREDISRKLVRAVGEPRDRFREDPARLLRAVRLAAELTYRIESNTFETISAMSEQLSHVAPERVSDELLKILMTRKPSVGFAFMVRTGLLKAVVPELMEGYRKKQDADHRHTIYKHVMETVDQVEADPVVRLAALLHDVAKPRVREKVEGEFRFWGHEEASSTLAREIMGRLKFSNATIMRVGRLIAHHTIGYHSGWSDGDVRDLIRRMGMEDVERLLMLRRADIAAHGRVDQKMEVFLELKGRIATLMEGPLLLTTDDLAIDGNRVMKVLGLSPGPEVGVVLNKLLHKAIDHPEVNTEEGLVALLGNMES